MVPSSLTSSRAALLALAVFACSANSLAVEAPEAKALEHSRRAAELHRAGRKQEALLEYQRAVDVAPSAIRVLNLASAYQDSGQPARAWATLVLLRGRYWRVLTKSQRDLVAAQEEQLKGVLGYLQLAVEPPGTRVAVDGVVLVTPPLHAPLVLEAGRHHLLFEREGYRSVQRRVDVAPQASTELFVTLVRNPAPGTADSGGTSTLLWAGAGASGAAAATACVFWALAAASKSDYDRHAQRYVAWEIDASDPGMLAARDDTRTYQSLAWGIGISSALLAVGTGVTWWLQRDAYGRTPEARILPVPTKRGIAVSF